MEQQRQLSRVRARIGGAIIEFVNQRLQQGRPDFHAEELRRWVQERAPGAPGSPDRVLRDLRQSGLIRYVVTDRRRSLYRLVPR